MHTHYCLKEEKTTRKSEKPTVKRLVQKYMLLDRVRCLMSTRRTKQIRSTVTKILV